MTAPLLHRVLLWLLLCLTLGCGGAFRQALERGDLAAQEGNWDQAAREYERAYELAPGDEDAGRKLAHARRKQAELRVAKGQALLRQGRAVDALTPFAQAVALDPFHPAGRQGLERAKAEVLQQAKTALTEGKDKLAFRLAMALRAVDREHAGAREVERSARHNIASKAVARGRAHEQKGAYTLALPEYGEALQYVTAHEEASSRAASARAIVRDQVTYFIALKNFDGENVADDLGSDVDAQVLSRGIDAALPLRIVDQIPEPKGGAPLQGMRLGGLFRGFQYQHQQSSTNKSCDYVCGTEWVENPQFASRKAAMRTAQTALRAAETRLATARSAIVPATQALDTASGARDARKLERDQAEQQLSQCRAAAPGDAQACSEQRARRDGAQGLLDQAEAALRTADATLRAAKTELASAESDQSQKALAADAARLSFEATPAKVEIDKHCQHIYRVDTHSVESHVEVVLQGESLYDTTPVLARSAFGKISKDDETFPAQAGVCSEVANGDALVIPSKAEAKKLVLASAIRATQRELLATFDSYRQDYLVRGRLLARDQKTTDAADAMVRYLTVMGANARGHDLDQAVAELAQLRQVDEAAIRIGVRGLAE